jgi:hypothetical protein
MKAATRLPHICKVTNSSATLYDAATPASQPTSIHSTTHHTAATPLNNYTIWTTRAFSCSPYIRAAFSVRGWCGDILQHT